MSDQSPGGSGQERYVDAAHRYRLGSRIATGGMGEVWRATDTALGRPVAVKLLKSEYADDATFRSRFESEARHAAALHHPNVAAVYDVGESVPGSANDGPLMRSAQPVPFLVMELVDGEPLSALLRGGRRLAPAAMRDLLAQAADGIGAAHRAGVVHRDVKPANLMVTPDRTIKITDFGIARASDGLGLTGTGQVMGTPQYLSPEQARGNPATPASDVYALGVVAWECLAGRRPFDKESAVATALAHLNDPVPALPDSVPADLAGVVERALAKDPAERYPDGDALAAALRDPATAATQVGAFAPVLPVPPDEGVTQVLAPVPAVPAAYDDFSSPVDPPRDEPGGVSPWWAFLGIVVIGAILVFVVLALTRDDGTDETLDGATTPPATSAAPSETPTPSDTPSSEPEPKTFDLDTGDFLGRDVGDVARELQDDYGLRVRTESVDNPGDRDEGAVESIDPARDLTEGQTVLVRYYAEPEPEPEPTPAPSEDDGGGDDGDDGGGDDDGGVVTPPATVEPSITPGSDTGAGTVVPSATSGATA